MITKNANAPAWELILKLINEVVSDISINYQMPGCTMDSFYEALKKLTHGFQLLESDISLGKYNQCSSDRTLTISKNILTEDTDVYLLKLLDESIRNICDTYRLSRHMKSELSEGIEMLIDTFEEAWGFIECM